MNWMKHRLVYFGLSGFLVGTSLFGLLVWGLNVGIDFKGGTLVEYDLGGDIQTEDLTRELENEGFDVGSIQQTSSGAYLLRLSQVQVEEKEKLNNAVNGFTEGEQELSELRFESVGPSVGQDLITKTLIAIVIASVSILIWVAIQFRSIKFGASAILAMFHDTLVLVGVFAFLGHFLGIEVDFLFVTAVLTTLSFSVHDTIVVFDRIRENQKKIGGEIYTIANRAISETMVRSLNNSFTILFMLVALILLGGSTIKWFAVALFVGTILGTYSSPFVAVSLLVTWDAALSRIRKKLTF